MDTFEERIKKIKALSAYSLPDNTADARLSAEEIKKKFYEPLLYLLNLLNEVEGSLKECATENETQTNEILDLKVRVAESIAKVDAVLEAAKNVRYDILSGDLPAKTYVSGSGNSQEIASEFETITRSLDNVIGDIMQLNQADRNLAQNIASALNQAKQYTDEKSVKMYKAKGSVMNYYELPTENQVGDVYNIVNADKEHEIDAGDNVVWTDKGTWDKLGGNYDHKPIFDNINYIGTGGIKAMSGYDQDTGEITLELFDFVNPEYDEDTGVLTINAELKELN